MIKKGKNKIILYAAFFDDKYLYFYYTWIFKVNCGYIISFSVLIRNMQLYLPRSDIKVKSVSKFSLQKFPLFSFLNYYFIFFPSRFTFSPLYLPIIFFLFSPLTFHLLIPIFSSSFSSHFTFNSYYFIYMAKKTYYFYSLIFLPDITLILFPHLLYH